MSIDTTTPDRVCIVGAGPSGLIMARQLRDAGIPFDVYEKNPDVGGIWDPAYEGSPVYQTTHFISSRYTSGFYGYPMPDSYAEYPSWREILDYIKNFAEKENLRQYITFNTPVEHAEQDQNGGWIVTAGGQRKLYRALVAAPGVTWHAKAPTYPGQESFTGVIRHSSSYYSPSEFAGKKVLIVGAGNSGVDIACDAAFIADAAFISLRRGYRFIPKHIFGLTLDVFTNEGGKLPEGVSVPEGINGVVDALTGDLTRYGLQAPDHDALSSHPIVNDQILHYLAHGDITAKPDISELSGASVVFVDGTREQIDLVLFATGYDYKLPFLDEDLFEWKLGHPQLYLNIFNRQADNLYVLGFIEFASAAYKRFEDMAQLIAIDLSLTGSAKTAFAARKRNDHPDLRGGHHYIDSPRHANYVDVHTYQEALERTREEFGTPIGFGPLAERYAAAGVAG